MQARTPQGTCTVRGLGARASKSPMPEEELARAMVMVMVMTDMNFLVISRGVTV